MKAVFDNFYNSSGYRKDQLDEKSSAGNTEPSQDIKVATNIAFPASSDIEHMQTRPTSS